MYMNFKLLAKNEKELETLTQAVRIYCQNVGIEKCIMLIMKSGKRHMTDGMELLKQEKLERSGKRKRTNTWEYWKLTPSNKWR